jgi:hypothetical protein
MFSLLRWNSCKSGNVRHASQAERWAARDGAAPVRERVILEYRRVLSAVFVSIRVKLGDEEELQSDVEE